MPRVIQVIETDEPRGKGVDGDVFRRVRTYWTLEGEWLGETRDPAPSVDRKYEQTARLAAQLVDVVRWALGEVDEFPAPPERVKGKPYPTYWWRGELRRRAIAAGATLSAPKAGGA